MTNFRVSVQNSLTIICQCRNWQFTNGFQTPQLGVRGSIIATALLYSLQFPNQEKNLNKNNQGYTYTESLWLFPKGKKRLVEVLLKDLSDHKKVTPMGRSTEIIIIWVRRVRNFESIYVLLNT